MSLEGKTALVTGAGSGIGRALAIEASRRGMKLALVGRRKENLHETRDSIEPSADCLIIPSDVTAADGRWVIRNRIAEAWGHLHVLVNNAGIVSAGPVAGLGDDELDHLIATNLVAPIALARDMLMLLRAGAPARIVNIGSVLGDIGFPLFAAYSASKFGLRGFSNALRRELHSLGIGVTYAAPRGARTDATIAIAPYVESLEMPLDSAETIARDVWNAVADERNSVYPRGFERLFVLAERLCPSIITLAVRSQLQKSRLQTKIDGSTLVDNRNIGVPPKRQIDMH